VGPPITSAEQNKSTGSGSCNVKQSKAFKNLNPSPTTCYRKRIEEVACENKPQHQQQQQHHHLFLIFSFDSYLLPHLPLQLAQRKLFYSTVSLSLSLSLSLPVSSFFSFISSLFLEFMDRCCQHKPEARKDIETRVKGF